MATINSANTYLTPTSGQIITPGQSAFSAYVSSTLSNVTGDNTEYTVIFDTELLDRTSNYNNGTGIFTAPVTGLYLFTVSLTIEFPASTGTDQFNIYLYTSTKKNVVSFLPTRNRATGFYGVSGYLTINGSALASMTATDTAYVNLGADSGTKTTSVIGDANIRYSIFSGVLIG